MLMSRAPLSLTLVAAFAAFVVVATGTNIASIDPATTHWHPAMIIVVDAGRTRNLMSSFECELEMRLEGMN
jgi:hypothetical protein